MSHIYYGLAGEGRGHAMRARTVIDHLRKNHQVTVLTFGDALSMLGPLYKGTSVEVREIPGMYLKYTPSGRVDYIKTGLASAPYLKALSGYVNHLASEMRARGAKLVVTDFEPITGRAAQKAGLPFWSLDHQHFLVACELGPMGWADRVKLQLMRSVVKLFYGRPDKMIVSGFYFPGLRRGHEHVKLVGVLLREELLAAKPTQEGHLVAYIRRTCPEDSLQVLSALGQPIRVYGLGERAPLPNVRFMPVSVDGFLRDLASCEALVTTAGNQLVGEALYLDKPVLALPERGNFEQELNAALLVQSGAGASVAFEDLRLTDLQDFLDRKQEFRRHIDRDRICGNERVFTLLDHALQTGGFLEQLAWTNRPMQRFVARALPSR